MNKEFNYVDDIVNRYIYQVTNHLSAKNRKDIEAELRTLISDMMEARTQGIAPENEDINRVLKENINSVLKELGNPNTLASKYSENTHYLISPVIYPAYTMVLKIVVGATFLSIMIATILGLLTNSTNVWSEQLGQWIGDILGGISSAFAWVTIIFVIFERKGINVKKLIPEWVVSSLPPVPSKESSIRLWEPIVTIILNILVFVILVLAPQLIGIYYLGESRTVIPIFDLDVLRTVLPLFLICIVLGIIKSIWEIIERKISLKYALINSSIIFLRTVLLIIIFTKFQIWNPNFVDQQSAIYHLSSSAGLSTLWEQFTTNFIIIIVLAFMIETTSTLYKAFKYQSN